MSEYALTVSLPVIGKNNDLYKIKKKRKDKKSKYFLYSDFIDNIGLVNSFFIFMKLNDTNILLTLDLFRMKIKKDKIKIKNIM